MAAKRKVRIGVDFLMVAMLPMLMVYALIGEDIHEWFGGVMFLLFISHHLLNLQWFRAFVKGRYTPFRILLTLVNVLLLLIMLALMVSGVTLSQYLFDIQISFIRKWQSVARKIHLVSSYWGFVIMSFHAGLHGAMVLKLIKWSVKNGTMILGGVAAIISVYGIYAFRSRNMAEYMLLKTRYVFFDFNEPLIRFMMDYVSVMLLFALIGYHAGKILSGGFRRKQK